MKWTNRGHQFDNIGEYYENIKRVYIYGAGELGAEALIFLNFLKNLNCNISFIDKNEYKQRQGYLNTRVISQQELLSKENDKHIVIVAASQNSTIEIINTLVEYGYKENFNLFSYTKFKEILPIIAVYRINKVFFPSISFLATTKCNLNCEACLAFTPYNKNQSDFDIVSRKKDIDKFFECVDYIDLFHISGGEPFLYPYLIELIDYIGSNYRDKIFSLAVSTNGTMLPSTELCQVLNMYNVMVYLDDYTEAVPGISNKFEEVLTTFKKHDVFYNVVKVDYWYDLCIFSTNREKWSEDELINHFDSCQSPFQELHDGRIFSCNYANYASYADLYKISSNDFFNLNNFDMDRKKELIEFRLGYTENGYVDFCKRCCGLFEKINKNLVPVAKQKSQSNL